MLAVRGCHHRRQRVQWFLRGHKVHGQESQKESTDANLIFPWGSFISSDLICLWILLRLLIKMNRRSRDEYELFSRLKFFQRYKFIVRLSGTARRPGDSAQCRAILSSNKCARQAGPEISECGNGTDPNKKNLEAGQPLRQILNTVHRPCHETIRHAVCQTDAVPRLLNERESRLKKLQFFHSTGLHRPEREMRGRPLAAR